jgi:hypothetical protein
MSTINLETEIIRRNRAVLDKEQASLDEQKKLDAEVDRVLQNADIAYRKSLMGELGFDYKLAEASAIQKQREDFANLPKDRVTDADAIKGICIEYGLRFLPTRFYKGALHEGIGPAMERFKGAVHFKLPVVNSPELMRGASTVPETPQFYVCAPAESFVLRPVPKDPLLFCRLSEKKFYLIHKWGSDLDSSEAEKRKGETTEANWNADTKEVDASDFFRRQMMAQFAQSNFGGLGIGGGSASSRQPKSGVSFW